jgi:hypothetical protein
MAFVDSARDLLELPRARLSADSPGFAPSLFGSRIMFFSLAP